MNKSILPLRLFRTFSTRKSFVAQPQFLRGGGHAEAQGGAHHDEHDHHDDHGDVEPGDNWPVPHGDDRAGSMAIWGVITALGIGAPLIYLTKSHNKH